MTTIAIAYHSGFGHTEVIAKKVAEGITAAGATATLHNVADLNDALWAALDKADAIVFGSPTYMGTVSAPFKAFMDASSKQWFGQLWKDKLAAGFTNSGGASGDKLGTLQAMSALAAQHSMVWVSQGLWPSAYSGDGLGTNRLSSWLGLMAQSDNAPASDTNPNPEDQASAVLFGKRIAAATARWNT
jgi:NAD(P)H dehydrogenase (quinone)